MLTKERGRFDTVNEARPSRTRRSRRSDEPATEPGNWVVRREPVGAYGAQPAPPPPILPVTSAGQARRTEKDLGRRRYTLGAYAYMASGLAVAAIVAHLTADSSFHHSIVGTLLLTPFVWPLVAAPLGLVMLLALTVDDMDLISAEAIFWVYAVLVGFSVDCIAMVYTGVSVMPVFLAGAITFAAMSLCGFITGRWLSETGSFVVAGLSGAGLVGITSFLLYATATEFALSLTGLIVFVTLAAWDRQRIEEIYRTRSRDNSAHGLAVLGALALYVDASVFPLLLQFKPRA